MGTPRRPSASRLKTILHRQVPTRWGENYLPCILATREEAPSISRASTLASSKLGRELHLLSPAERDAALIALYHPEIIEIHEQKMLSPVACEHPLTGFPGLTVRELPPLRGLVAVADSLGLLNLLPTIKISDQSDQSASYRVVFPFVGDFLLFRRTSRSEIRCINWSLKDTQDSFKRALDLERLNPRSRASNIGAIARHQVEEVYHRDGNIPTHFISGDSIDREVVANLSQLFLHHRDDHLLSPQQEEVLLDSLRLSIGSRTPPMEIIVDFCARWGVGFNDCRRVFYRAIWERRLRVDLFRPVLIDVPLRSEKRDVIDVYAHWFE